MQIMSQNNSTLVTMTRLMVVEGEANPVVIVEIVFASTSATMTTQMSKLSNERIRSTLLRE